MQRSKKPASVLILAVFLTAVAVGPCAGRQSLGSLNHRLNATSRKINEIRSRLRYTKKQQRDAAYRLVAAERRLEVTRANLRDTQAQLQDTRDRLAATQAELERIEKRLKERNDLLAARLADTYKHGSVSYFSVVLGSADFWDLLSRAYDCRKIMNRDVELVETIKKDKQAVEELKASLEDQERVRAGLQRKQWALTHTAYEQTEEREHILRDIEKDRAKYEQMLAAFQAESRSIADMIRQMQRTPEGRTRLQQAWRGSFMKPVPGRITSGFGRRVHPIHKTLGMHTGVDIGAPMGTVIRAAAGGYVVSTGSRGVYGNTVVLDHGGGVITFYAHCSGFLVRAGATVRQGQPIALVGSTGLSTGPHVHFEVQKDGISVPPF
ncbi:MAG TPA: peptidoglycan DD-metalloendopeptidase family protein [Armatimonadota bacterium]|nr:peptidoglycan DD-metalloendopeptidase family protein [Armatimonadota bacterium]